MLCLSNKANKSFDTLVEMNVNDGVIKSENNCYTAKSLKRSFSEFSLCHQNVSASIRTHGSLKCISPSIDSGYNSVIDTTAKDNLRSILSRSYRQSKNKNSSELRNETQIVLQPENQKLTWSMSLCNPGNLSSKHRLLSKSVDSFANIKSISSSKILCYDRKKILSKNKLLNWNNPVIGSNNQLSLPSTCSTEILSKKSFKKIYSSFSFTRDMLKNVNVLGQIENKFIACIFHDSKSLVLVDQHAAHERVRLEKLLNQIGYYSDCTKAILNQTAKLFPPLKIRLQESDFKLLLHFKKEFEEIGVVFSFKLLREISVANVYITSIPSIFVNACETTTHAKGSSLNSNLIKEFLLEQIYAMQSTNGHARMSNTTIFKALASYACHGAIKFGDPLEHETCVKLMNDLSNCKLPFQCAHGRPSIAPLLNIDLLQSNTELSSMRRKPNLKRLCIDH